MEKADKKMTFSGDRKDTVDVHGGWQDATGDYGKHLSHLSYTNFFVPQQIPLVAYSLCKSYKMLDKKNDDNFTQFKKRILDELLYGADYLVRIKNPEGSFYRSVSAPGPEKKPEDRRISQAMTGFSIRNKKNDTVTYTGALKLKNENRSYEVGFSDGEGSQLLLWQWHHNLMFAGDFPSKVYLKCAEDAFNYLEKNNQDYGNRY